VIRDLIAEEIPARLAAFLDREAHEPDGVLPAEIDVPPHLLERALFGPLRSAAARPGKEFRARLLGIAWTLGGGHGDPCPELLAIIEAYHLGSLIVDDIEDGSERRRGSLSLHRLVGLPIALNAGNWLYFWPGVLLSRVGFEPAIELGLRSAIDRAVLRCHYGQALDLSVRVSELRRREVCDVVLATTRLKTGSLMELAAELGAISARARPAVVRVLAEIGRDLGIALQMLDDLSGITSERRREKGFEDLTLARPSWVWAWLAELADDVSYLRFRTALEAVVSGERTPDTLARDLSMYVSAHGRNVIRAKLGGVRARARALLADPAGISELEDELSRLERYDA
jgi:geranylgeranyl pyrophosphate synthase